MRQNNGELLATLEQLHKRYPHWRFGQLIANVAAWARGDQFANVGEVSDKALLAAAKRHLNKLKNEGNKSSPRNGKSRKSGEALAALRRLWRQSAAAGTDKMTMKEIDAEIRQARRERR